LEKKAQSAEIGALVGVTVNEIGGNLQKVHEV
jgi:hypothetical protein